MAMVDRYTTYVELFVDAVTMDTADKLDPTDGVAKGVTIAFVGLGVVLVIGTLMFGWLESMKWVDAAYFTVVTATTVGFGDYCPNSFGGKVGMRPMRLPAPAAFALRFSPSLFAPSAASWRHFLWRF